MGDIPKKDNRPILAFLYDFDRTLCTTDMQNYSFIPHIGMKEEAFWKEVRDFAEDAQMDSVLAYMYMMIRKSSENRRSVHRDDFVALGKDIEFFPGVADDWFGRINRYVESLGACAEHYIISSGLKEIIEGSAIGEQFSRIYACEYFYDENGVAVWPKMAVNYTGKTQFLFRINKGVLDITENRLLNRMTPPEERRIPFQNMIYFGDGFTDVPCMRLVHSNGGFSIAVYPPKASKKELSVSANLLLDGRVNFVFPADYRAGGNLEQTVFAIIRKICADSALSALHKTHHAAAETWIQP